MTTHWEKDAARILHELPNRLNFGFGEAEPGPVNGEFFEVLQLVPLNLLGLVQQRRLGVLGPVIRRGDDYAAFERGLAQLR